MRLVLASVLLSALMAGCASDNTPRIVPTELTAISQQVPVEQLWSRNLDDAGRGRFEPLVTDAAVTVADEDGLVARYERVGGDALWRRDLDRRLVSAVGGNDDIVFVSGTDGLVIAMNADDGSTLWETRASSDVLAPIVLQFDTAVVRSADGRVVRLDVADGSERWSSSWVPPALTVNGYSRPLVLDGGVLVGLDDGRVVALNSANGRTIWEAVLSRPTGRSEVDRLVDVDADILVDDEGIYVVNFQGRAARLEPGRGGIDWAVDMSSTAGLDISEQTLVVVDEEGVVNALDKRSGSLLWSQDALRGRRLSAPRLVDGHVVVGDFEGFLHVLDASNGVMIGRRKVTDGAISSRPMGDANSLVVQSREGEVRVLRLVPGSSS